MTKRHARDHLILKAIGVTLVVLAVGFGLAWFYLQHAERLSREITYLALPSIAISRDGHSISAGIAIRTSAADADWAKKNKSILEQTMKSALLEVDPVKVREPGGLKKLQETLRESSNARLQTTRVQEVVVTDFLVSEGDL
ncbi:MAG TPA: flagellar basal body-associated FliL family protein [Noviherbaspirillum sp.]